MPATSEFDRNAADAASLAALGKPAAPTVQHKSPREFAGLETRQLRADETQLLSDIFMAEQQVLRLIDKVRERYKASNCTNTEYNRTQKADYARFLAIAKTDTEMGFMALERAVLQPQSGLVG